jgi:transcriptional/translational regulatory protein YebC/TACO1
MGTDGCVAFQFQYCGRLIFDLDTPEEELMDWALEAGAQDVITHVEDGFEVITNPYDFVEVKEFLEQKGLTSILAEVGMRPENDINLSGEDALRMQKLLDALENLDDVQAVYTNAIFAEEME